MRLTIDDFPDPDGPTIAIDYPWLIVKFIFFKTYTFYLLGYENEAFTNYMRGLLLRSKSGFKIPGSTLIGSSII